ncbi:hypothetical protein EYF80_002768 [Liparis tanakae]|uniref:Uncharacterized protein n=1 Tax=Liparis tanakae TaxID=230148 RepID=A0A4Z2JB64_9TELE|nr:hypothetical protein EYF80_002768 [Liparis tanakae]
MSPHSKTDTLRNLPARHRQRGETPVPLQFPHFENTKNSLKMCLMSDATFPLWTLRTEAACFHTDSNRHDKTAQPGCDCVSNRCPVVWWR